MANPGKRWWSDHQLWVEAFVILNIGFLTLDIYLAHSVNQFRSRRRIHSAILLGDRAAAFCCSAWHFVGAGPVLGKIIGHLVGWSAILIGLVGVILHLESYFFLEHTIRSLTYSAPFAAPLAYTGLGFLLIMNRMVDPNSPEWAQWIVLFTLGGFFGNFVFSLTDHAEDGFFNPLEWVPIYGQRHRRRLSGRASGHACFAPLHRFYAA